MVKRRFGGYLLLEVLIVTIILAGLFALLVPGIRQVEKLSETRRHVVELLLLEQNISDQLKAQLNRVGNYGCYAPLLKVQVGKAISAPQRIKNYTLDEGSDWLYANDVGECSTYGAIQSGILDIPAVCNGVKVGDRLLAGTCQSVKEVTVLSVSEHKITAQWPEASLEGEVHVYTQEPFYWFIQPGKVGGNSFWRRSAIKGNALELTPGVEHVRISLLLDIDEDGVADEVANQTYNALYSRVSGFLVEYHFRLFECTSHLPMLTYISLRGDEWKYDNVCSGIGKLIVANDG